MGEGRRILPRLEVHNLAKSFGSTQVLRDVSIVVQPGEIHGLVGENGSGKSTLVKLLTGYHTCEKSASISVDGNQLAVPVHWQQAHAAGISVVHQDLGLIDDLSVAENIGVGGYRTRGLFRTIDWRRQKEVAASALERLASSIDPMANVGSLSASERAEVAVARALRDHKLGTGLIILDESTRSLSRDELIRFYDMLNEVVNQGTSVLLVSHSLEEVLTQTHKVALLRDGCLVGSGLSSSELTEREVVQLMLGKEVRALSIRSQTARQDAVVTVSGLSIGNIKDIHFSAGRGEVVGITGLPGSGFERLPYLLSGAQKATSGMIQINRETVDLSKTSVSRCLRAGIALVPERRELDGLAFELSMRENFSLPTLRSRGRWWFVSKRWQEEDLERMTNDLGIRPPNSSLLIKQLSGGNQQKVLMAKWLSVGPKLLILHEPTQAVDVGAKQDILRQIHKVADTGVCVLVVSTDVMDLASVCDRVLVFSGAGHLSEIETRSGDEILEMIYAGARAV